MSGQEPAVESLQVDFLYEPVLQAAELAPSTVTCLPCSRHLTVADAGMRTQWAMAAAKRPGKLKNAAQLPAGSDMTAQLQPRLQAPQRTALAAIQLLQTFAAGSQPRSFTAAASMPASALQQSLPSLGVRSDAAASIFAAVTRVAAVEQPSVQWSCLQGCQSAGPADQLKVTLWLCACFAAGCLRQSRLE